MMRAFSPILIVLARLAVSEAFQYIWPDESERFDIIETARWDQLGYNQNQITALVEPCGSFLAGNGFGRANAADWIRTAFHDMATFDINANTGGMDGSIRFPEELARAENAGDGFAFTLLVFQFLVTPSISFADSLALGAVLAMENCGGPEIPYRFGRIDAMTPNSPGVPEPQQPLKDHISSFKKQGFTKEEMIGLVACGHTFGGVQNKLFPQIVPPLNDPNNTESNHPFDSTFVEFDNKIATEYINRSTKNPLVVGQNETTNSDGRIFASDGDRTMGRFASSPKHFAQTCQRLVAKMIDTVPKDVKLTGVLEALPAKPNNVDLMYVGDGTLQLSGEVRFFNEPANSNRVVHMRWTDRNGQRTNTTAQLGTTPDRISTAVKGHYQSSWYTFNNTAAPTFLALPEASGIHALSFEMSYSDYQPKKTYDQDGRGFRIYDEVMWAASSCGGPAGRYDVAVRKDVAASIQRVFIENFQQSGVVDLPVVNDHTISRPATPGAGSAGGLYEIWSLPAAEVADVLKTNPVQLKFIGADGKRFVSSGNRNVTALPACSS